MTPLTRLGPEWRRFTIPVELSGAERWGTGLSIQSMPLAEGAEMKVFVRNAYVHPVEAASPKSR
jgi:hypothetical protein